MKQIQEWLGHSLISTTADIYSHLDYSAEITGKSKKGYGIKGVNHYEFGYIRKLKPDNEPQIGDRVILARFKDDFSLISDNRE